ncbi:multidrug resistance-associated protein 4 isoform X1 [Selaginella moellendorffii]|uniref:multidrug resistance-associated protein 4 isoform X1 n=1 Tax=Selaginella moellendorffii TaxID=88036 RepID=UPI000D1CB7BB|nr:multidrug resistance-associated protein 4 isoform X1 [Selaginella moellendorffii]|eukprot:XP_024524379.1 multidrug resistance-associated protein 4 isoform X1 [Selaginella moellendorffii]
MAPNPQEGASFVSLALWHWMQPLINLANKRPLEMDDLYDLCKEETTVFSDKRWNKAREKNKKGSVWRVMLWFQGRKLLCYAMTTRILWLACGILQVYAVKALVLTVEHPSSMRWWKGFVLLLAAVVFPLLQMLCQSYLSVAFIRLGVQIRAAVCMAVFNKILVMNAVSLSHTSNGQLLNIIGNDMQKLMDFLNAFPFVAVLIIDVLVITGVAAYEIGISAIPGILIILLAQFFQIGLGRRIKSLRRRALVFIDARVRMVGDVVTGIRVIKYNGWVVPFLKQIAITRARELSWIAKASFMRGVATAVGDAYVPLACLATFGVYVLLHGGNLNAKSTFTVLPFLGVLYKSAGSARPGFLIFGEAMIGMDRVQRFLNIHVENTKKSALHANATVKAVSCSFTWEPSGTKGSSRQLGQPVLRNINLEARKGELVAIVGSTGSGKSSLLLGLLGELKVLRGSYSLQQDAVYVPQQPWIINDTVRNNILFGSDFDLERYQSVLSACALDQDASCFPNGSESEIGERGINLSGGQKARISLARACYNASPIVLVDDPFAAVDVPTTQHLIQHVLGGVLKGRTVIIVTNNEMCLTMCNKVYRLEYSTLHLSEAEKEINRGLVSYNTRSSLESSQQSIEHTSPVVLNTTNAQLQGSSGSLVKKEISLASRGIAAKDLKEYFNTMGWALVILVGITFVITQCALTAGDYWLSVWTDKKYNLQAGLYVAIYAALAVGFLIFASLRVSLFTEATNNAARKLHSKMAENILRSPVTFFDHNPTGRIINRFTKDQSAVDEILPFTLQQVIAFVGSCLGALALIAILLPWFMLVTPIYLMVFIYMRQRYVAICCDVKRLDGVSRSAVYAHLVESIEGVVSIRAYGAEKRFMDRFVNLVDKNNQAGMMYAHASRWFATRMEMTVIFNLAVVAAFVIALRNSISPGIAGIILVQSLKLSGLFQFTVRSSAEAENQFTSVERIQEYTHLPVEPDCKDSSKLSVPNEWPHQGTIEFRNYTMAYREDLSPALNNISFTVEGGEKLGILGRTGSGKSSLVAAIFRMVQNDACSGSIIIDDLDIQKVKLDDLRRRLSIIPQDPVLFRGSLRFNLDPFSEHSDKDMYEALARVHVAEKVKSIGNGLDSEVTENGNNFSLGERQLICLARTLLRKSRIVILDEATAAIDNKTDRLIQSTMREVFESCTCLTVAHRINTIIDCGMVLVLDTGGHVVEYDSPYNLLKAEEVSTDSKPGVFANMVAQCGETIAAELTRMAEDAMVARQQNQI